MTDSLNRQLGEYRLLERIGAGGMGEVYLARHDLMGKSYAVKVLPAKFCSDPSFVARFRDEARVMADLHHPNIVQVHNMGCQNGEYFIAMDYVPGPQDKPRNLSDELADRSDHRLKEARACIWALQIVGALAYAHQRGVVHRDIKPANILIDADGKVRLTDFGLAKAIGNESIISQIHQSMQSLSGGRTMSAGRVPSGDSLDLAATGAGPGKEKSSDASGIMGTYDYMAPEQRGEFDGAIDARTDIYAFGVLLYRMLTGRRPVGSVKAPSQVAGVHPNWDAVVDRCLEYAPGDRYPSADAILGDLRRLGAALKERDELARRPTGEEERNRAEAVRWKQEDLRHQEEPQAPPYRNHPLQQAPVVPRLPQVAYAPQQDYSPQLVSMPQQAIAAGPSKSKVTAALLAFFLGCLGIHNFYLGHRKRGLTQLLITVLSLGFAWTLMWVWALVEFAQILKGTMKDEFGQPLI